MIVSLVTEVSAELGESVNALLPQLSSSARPLSLEALTSMVRAPGTSLFVAHHDDQMVGMLTLVTFLIPTGRRALIEDVVVDESVRGLGIGVALTTAALDHARQLGVTTVDLTSRPARVAANALYKKVGFSQRETNVYRFSLES
jgi:ribosomal protein S18 acetylase RimI-like enzyme